MADGADSLPASVVVTFAAMATRRRGGTLGRRAVIAAATAAAIGAGTAFAGEPGHGRSAPSASGATGVVSTAFNGTAYLKTSNTVAYADQPVGLARLAAQALIDRCNDIRTTRYHLSPASPPEAVMAALDITVEEKWFSTDKALSVDTGQLLTLPDMQRWSAALEASLASGSGELPAMPPDCAQRRMVDVRHGTLWRDGLVYQLRYDTSRALARPARKPLDLGSGFAPFSDAPESTRLGERCREVVGGVHLPGVGHSCIWTLFPYVSHLNWPFAPSGRAQFGPTPAMFKTIVPIAVEHGRAIPPSVFDIPAGFTVVGP